MSSLDSKGGVHLFINNEECYIPPPQHKPGTVRTGITLGGIGMWADDVAKLHEFMQFHQNNLELRKAGL